MGHLSITQRYEYKCVKCAYPHLLQEIKTPIINAITLIIALEYFVIPFKFTTCGNGCDDFD